MAPVSYFVFYKPFLYQLVPRCLKDAQGKIIDATLEKATLPSTGPGKIGLLLENLVPKLQMMNMNLRSVHTF